MWPCRSSGSGFADNDGGWRRACCWAGPASVELYPIGGCCVGGPRPLRRWASCFGGMDHPRSTVDRTCPSWRPGSAGHRPLGGPAARAVPPAICPPLLVAGNDAAPGGRLAEQIVEHVRMRISHQILADCSSSSRSPWMKRAARFPYAQAAFRGRTAQQKQPRPRDVTPRLLHHHSYGDDDPARVGGRWQEKVQQWRNKENCLKGLFKLLKSRVFRSKLFQKIFSGCHEFQRLQGFIAGKLPEFSRSSAPFQPHFGRRQAIFATSAGAASGGPPDFTMQFRTRSSRSRDPDAENFPTDR